MAPTICGLHRLAIVGDIYGDIYGDIHWLVEPGFATAIAILLGFWSSSPCQVLAALVSLFFILLSHYLTDIIVHQLNLKHLL
jgi:hypothetical protein